MADKYSNVKKLITHFDSLIQKVEDNPDNYYFHTLLEQDKTWDSPEAQASMEDVDEWLATLITIGRLPVKDETEYGQMQELLDEKWNSEKLSRPELLALIRKYPPVILETVLPCVMVMYLLRELKLAFDTDKDAFVAFYNGWHHMVLGV